MIKCQFVLKEHGKEMHQKNHGCGGGGGEGVTMTNLVCVSDYNKEMVGTTEVSIF